MIKALLNIRLRSMFHGMFRGTRNTKRRGAGMTILLIVLMVYVAVVFVGMFGMLFFSLCGPFCAAGLNWLYFALAGIFAFVLCVFGSTFMAQAQIFESKDNELLLSMPVPPSAILLTRIAAILLMNYLYSALVLLPAGVVYFLQQPATVGTVVFFVLVLLLLPLLALAVSCLFGWLLALISSKMRNKNIVTMLATVVFLFVYFAVYTKLQSYLELLIANGESIAASIRRVLPPAYHMGVAIADGSIISFLLFALFAIAPFVLVYLLLARNFIGIATASHAASKVRYRAQALKVSGIRGALFRNDLRHFLGNSMYVLNAAMGSILLVVMCVFLVIKREELLGLAPLLVTGGMSVPALLGAGICMVMSMNVISAPSISLEAKTGWIVRSVPVRTFDILMSKVWVHAAASAPFALLGGVVVSVLFPPTPAEAAALFLAPQVFVLFTAVLGVIVNLRFPKSDWISEVHAVKQGASVIITMLIAMGAVIAPCILYITVAKAMGLAEYILIWTAVFAAMSGGMITYLRRGGSRSFEAL